MAHPPAYLSSRVCHVFMCSLSWLLSTNLEDSCIREWAQSKELSLKKLGPSNNMSQAMIVLLRSRGVEVAEALDDVLITDQVANFCMYPFYAVAASAV